MNALPLPLPGPMGIFRTLQPGQLGVNEDICIIHAGHRLVPIHDPNDPFRLVCPGQTRTASKLPFGNFSSGIRVPSRILRVTTK